MYAFWRQIRKVYCKNVFFFKWMFRCCCRFWFLWEKKKLQFNLVVFLSNTHKYAFWSPSFYLFFSSFSGKKPKRNKEHVPKSNGCGSYGIKVWIVLCWLDLLTGPWSKKHERRIWILRPGFNSQRIARSRILTYDKSSTLPRPRLEMCYWGGQHQKKTVNNGTLSEKVIYSILLYVHLFH